MLTFIKERAYPKETLFFAQSEEIGPWGVLPLIEELKSKARMIGLWNLFLPRSESGAELSNLEYAPLCEIMGRSLMAPTVRRSTRETWRCWPAMGRPRNKDNG